MDLKDAAISQVSNLKELSLLKFFLPEDTRDRFEEMVGNRVVSIDSEYEKKKQQCSLSQAETANTATVKPATAPQDVEQVIQQPAKGPEETQVKTPIEAPGEAERLNDILSRGGNI